MKGKAMIILFIGLIASRRRSPARATIRRRRRSRRRPWPPADAAVAANPDNPFFKPYGTPFNVPPFDRIKTEHFLPAIQEGIRREQAEVDAIVSLRAKPTFENTVAALDHTGIFLSEVNGVFGSLRSALTNKDLQAVAQQTSPMMAEHRDNIGLNPKLFERVKAVYDKRASLALGREELFLLENTYKGFVRGGALLDESQKARFRELNQELSKLSLKFGDNVLAETNAFQLVIDNKADLAGLPPSAVAMAAAAAKQAGLEDGKWLFTIQVPSMTPFLTYSERRPLREKLHRAYFMKGDNDNEFDNKDTLRRIAALRLERAKLLGYPSHAAFVLEENMAKTPEKVNEFLAQLWEPTNVKAKEEAAELQALMDRDPKAGKAKLASWDWWLYTERLRQQKYALDDSALRPYFKLDNVRDGIFALCDKLYGLKFIAKPDLPRYHPDVQVFEVQEADGRHTGVLYMDFHPRPSKRSGAWSGGLPARLLRSRRARPAHLDDHLQLHRAHGRRAGAALDRRGRDVLPRVRPFARDPLLAGPLPQPHHSPRLGRAAVADHGALGPRARAPGHLCQALPDRRDDPRRPRREAREEQPLQPGLHHRGIPGRLDPRHGLAHGRRPRLRRRAPFEQEAMDKIGLIPEIVPRYRSTYFSHIFSGGYSAGYYDYIWSEVLDCDAYEPSRRRASSTGPRPNRSARTCSSRSAPRTRWPSTCASAAPSPRSTACCATAGW